jgi:Spy/CpxP family protein refolding chaperone
MRQRIGRRVLATLLLLAPAAPGDAQSFAWWKSEQFQKDVGLTPDQCARIDNIFQSTLPKLRESKAELDKHEAKLSDLIAEAADEARVVREVDRVEAIRAALNKMHTLMLLRERQVLTPDQLVKFKAAYDLWRKDHPRPPRPGDEGIKK